MKEGEKLGFLAFLAILAAILIVSYNHAQEKKKLQDIERTTNDALESVLDISIYEPLLGI